MNVPPTMAMDDARALPVPAIVAGVRGRCCWQLGLPRARWPVFAIQLAVFSSMFGLNPTASYGGEGSVLRQFGWLMLFAMALLGITATPAHLRAVLGALREWRWAIGGMAAFWLFALLSTAWAEFPEVTFKRAMLLGIVVVITMAAGATMAVLRVALSDVLIPPLLALLLISFLFTAAFPGIAFTPIGWQGMTGQKNTAGQLAAVLLLCVWFTTSPKWYGRPLGRVTIALLALAAFVMARSATSLVTLLAAGAFAAAVGWVVLLRKHSSWAVPGLLAALVLVALGWCLYLFDLLPGTQQLADAGLAALGKSETLTGRTKLWEFVLAQEAYRSNWIGLGYGGFWDSSMQRMLYVIANLGFRPIQAHNGYLDLVNEVGYVGLGIVVATVVIVLLRALALVLRTSGGRAATAAAALVIFVVVSNFSESSLFRTTTFLNLLFMAAAFVTLPRAAATAAPRGSS